MDHDLISPFSDKPKSIQSKRVDRFVLHRDEIDEKRHTWDSVDLNKWLTNTEKVYASRVWEALGLEKRKIFDVKKPIPPWPCKPRKKSFLSTVNDLPYIPTDLVEYNSSSVPLIDFGKDNILVSVCRKQYKKCSWDNISSISVGFTSLRVYCCKLDPRGKLLLLGTQTGVIEIHNNSLNQLEQKAQCSQENHSCNITTVDWSPTGNSFVAGCSWGVVTSFTRNAEMIASKRVYEKAISFAKVSPDTRYVAVLAVQISKVTSLMWPMLDIDSTMDQKGKKIKALTWHPWSSALLGVGAVGAMKQGTVALWHPASKKVEPIKMPLLPYTFDDLLFSNSTGEVVFSMWHTVYLPKSYWVTVMSGPGNEEDRGDRILCYNRPHQMVFNPEGTILATISTSRKLSIWKFSPENKADKEKKRFYEIPVYLDESSQGYSFR